MLEVRDLSIFYGQHHALDGVSVQVAPGEIVTILGANGAGKSSLLRAVAGLVPAQAGSQVVMDGNPIHGLAPHEIVEAGLALVPEGRDIFGELTVLENLKLGAYPERAKGNAQANLERVLSLFPKLAEREKQIARTMSGGEQQMVAIGRAMMSAPAILLLDEPSLGLSPKLCSELFRALAAIRQTGVGILLVEQNAKQSLAIADRGYLLETGRIVGADAADALARDPAVQRAYLGGGAAAPTPAASKAPAAAPPTNLKRLALDAVQRAVDRPKTGAVPDGDISGLVQRAVQRQSDHINAARAAGNGTFESVRPRARNGKSPPAPTSTSAPAPRPRSSLPPLDTAGRDLDSVLREIEQAAANALSRRGRRDIRTTNRRSHDE